MMTRTVTSRSLRSLVLCPWVVIVLACAIAAAQETASQASTQTSSQNTTTQQPAQPSNQESENTHHLGLGGELAKEERVAQGAEQEEHSDLKHSAVVQKLAKLTGMSVHGAHIFALCLNFAVILFVFFWFGRKTLPAIFRSRNDAIRKALEEARRASDDANKRLSDIESRLRQMDAEIGKMQASAEKEADGEDARIKQAAEEEIRKVVEAAGQEIDAAAKQARRDLSAHTADLAVALARKQINVDANTDKVLVRDFATKLTGNGGKDGH